MDFFAHVFWGIILTYFLSKASFSKRFYDTRAKKIVSVLAFAVLDFVFLPMIFYRIYLMVCGAQNGFPFHYFQLPGWQYTAYYISHSFVTTAVVGLLLYFVARKYVVPVVAGFLFEIITDVATHEFFFALHPFYPLWDKEIIGLTTWGTPSFMLANYVLICLGFLLVWWHSSKEKKAKVKGKKVRAGKKKKK